MAWTLETTLALATLLILGGPTAVLLRAWKETRNPRVLLAVIGFSIFLATELIVLIDQLGLTPNIEETEIVEFVGDILMALFLSAAFLVRVKGEK